MTAGERTAEAQYADGVLRMQVPAQESEVLVRGGAASRSVLPPVKDGWHEVLRSAEDGYGVSVFVR